MKLKSLENPVNRCNSRQFVLCLQLLGILTVSLSFVAEAQEPAACPSTEEIRGSIEKRIGTALAIKSGLEKLSLGDTTSEIIPESLFTVELSNAEAVEARVGELRQNITEGKIDKSADFIRKCVGEASPDGKRFRELLVLEREVDALRLAFLSLPLERRQALLSVHREASDQKASLKVLEAEKVSAELRSSKADESLREAENQAQTAARLELREIATARALLEKRRKKIAELTIKWTEQLEALTSKAKNISDELSRDASVLSRGENVTEKDIRAGYLGVRDTWRQLVDTLFVRLGDAGETRNVPEIPAFPQETVSKVKDETETKEFESAYKEAASEAKALGSLKEKLEKEEGGMLFRLLLTAGKLRAQFIEEMAQRGVHSQFQLDNDYLADLFREVRLVPYRPVVLIKSFILETKDQLGNGVSGFLQLLNRLFILFLFIVTPVASWFLLKRASKYLDDVREWLFRNGSRKTYAKFAALWIRRLNPYLPWVMMLIAAKLARVTVANTELEGAAEILPYFEYFIFYRIFRMALSESVLAARSYYSMLSPERVGSRIEKTAKFVGVFFLVAACLLQATQTIARRGLFYQLIWDILFYLGPFWLATAANWWKTEISAAAAELLPNILGQKLSKWCIGRWSWFFCLPTIIILLSVVLSRMIFAELSQLDSAKRVSAQLFRRKIESAAKERGIGGEKRKLTEDYLSKFDLGIPADESLFVSPEETHFNEITGVIETWASGKSAEHSLAIQGEKGIGKSCLLKLLENHFSKLKVVHVSVSDKITAEGALFDFLGQALGLDLKDGQVSLENADPESPKTLVLIDEGQNLFLAKRGGFKAFRAFTDLCNARTSNFFWCVTINRHAWSYLNAVSGGSQYFRRVFLIEGWSDEDIGKLILSRHEKTGYELEYDSIIFAMGDQREGVETRLIQDRYFELLWDQSRGNPRAALILWLSALEVIGDKKLRVGLPAAPPSRPLAGLADDELFVIAAVIRHENLTAEEAEIATNLSAGVVSHALRLGLERGFLDCSKSRRYRVVPLWQAPLTQGLMHKNFV